MKLTRREMLEGMAAAAAAATLPAGELFAGAENMVGFKGDPAESVKKAIETLGGISKFVAKGDKVVIKPNMGFASPPDKGANTSPVVVYTIAELALKAGAKSVQVLDNPVQNPQACAERNGYQAALAKLPDVVVKLVRDAEFFAPVEIPNGRQLRKAKVMRALLDADTIISVPTAKSHGGAMVTFSLKNWMGAVSNRGEWHREFDLHQCIADFATYIKPKLIVLDASRIMTTNGPSGPGELKKLQTILAGTDQVAIDSVAVTFSDWDGRKLGPNDVPHIRIAAEMGVGRIRTAALPIRSIVA
jgi:uncharacterized protein (DUF362 family)